MKTIEIKEQYEIPVKRFYLPLKIIKKCPTCGGDCETDFSSNYLSYPVINKELSSYFYCDKCDSEFQYNIELKVSVNVGDEITKL